ncbi:conserved hypothetical protein [Capnocytophaga canimorsus]|uniref:Uncharacterized protein n=1 Tax=Capnocytophaga canimorsus TaxID=28188 RepID=A0A0B7IF87_9FLAO|nr:hypothetical protein [Capnocytophaga canimorsus]CEN49324.1 conserved hypothetical protein [Capnocytophaga canimorsus]
MATKKEDLKANGKLKKGFRYNENGRIVKAKIRYQEENKTVVFSAKVK